MDFNFTYRNNFYTILFTYCNFLNVINRSFEKTACPFKVSTGISIIGKEKI